MTLAELYYEKAKAFIKREAFGTEEDYEFALTQETTRLLNRQWGNT